MNKPRLFTHEDVIEHVSLIRNLCDAPHWSADRKARIRYLADTILRNFPAVVQSTTQTNFPQNATETDESAASDSLS